MTIKRRGRIITVENPRRYSLRLAGHVFDAVVDEAAHSGRSVNGEFVTLIEEALAARADAREQAVAA